MQQDATLKGKNYKFIIIHSFIILKEGDICLPFG
jgi:hypothetical protein